MRLVFIGAPGAGKGTQAQRLSAEKGWTIVATGDLLRTAIAAQTPLGQLAHAYIQRGELVPDPLVNQIVAERIATLEAFILDGYPRNLTQAQMLETILPKPLDAVIYFEISEDALIARLGGRRICPQCGAVFHIYCQPQQSGRPLRPLRRDAHHPRRRPARHHPQAVQRLPRADRTADRLLPPARLAPHR
jgi:adenylate kinase